MPPGSRPSIYGVGGWPSGLPPAVRHNRPTKSSTVSPGPRVSASAATCSPVRLIVAAGGEAAAGGGAGGSGRFVADSPTRGAAPLGEQPAEIADA